MYTQCSAPLCLDFKSPRAETGEDKQLESKQCKGCSFETSSELIQLRHVVTNDRECNWSHCEHCYMFFDSAGDLQRHVTIHHPWSITHGYKSIRLGKLKKQSRAEHLIDKELAVKLQRLEQRRRPLDCLKRRATWTRPTLTLSCEFCDFQTKSKRALRHHLRVQHMADSNDEYKCETGGFKCLECDFKHKYMYAIRFHIRAKHLSEEEKSAQWHKCELCNYQAPAKCHLKDHFARKHSNVVLKCEFCEYSTKSERALERHARVRHTASSNELERYRTETGGFQCVHCVYKSERIDDIRKHIRARHLTAEEKSQQWYSCERCEYQTPRRSRLREHIAGKHTETAHTWDLLEVKAEGQDTELGAQEQQYRFGAGGFKCLHCDYKSGRMDQIRRHIRARHLTAEEKRQQWHNCEHCDYQTPEKHRLKDHVGKKHSIVSLNCTFCAFVTENKRALAQHVRIQHAVGGHKSEAPGGLQCLHCDYRSERMSNMRVHIRSKHLTGPEKFEQWLKCEHCSYQTPRKHRLRDHIAKKHSKVTLRCELCEFQTTYKGGLVQHVRLKHTSKSGEKVVGGFECPHCDYRNKRLDHVRTHIRARHLTDAEKSEQWHKCERCDFQTSEKHRLKKHVAKRHSDVSLTCKLCEFTTRNQRALGQHVRIQHRVRGYGAKRFKCLHCEYKSEWMGNIRAHFRDKHLTDEEKSKQWLKCDQCEYQTPRRHRLKDHMGKKHPVRAALKATAYKTEGAEFRCGSGGFKCLHCDYTHKYMYKIRYHIRVKHLTEEEKLAQWHKCPSCKFRTPEQEALRMHIFRKHSDKTSVDWLQCDACAYKTKVKKDLVSHKRIHHGPVEVKCEFCPSMLQPRFLKTHIATAHKERVTRHKCEWCEKSFRMRACLTRHVQIRHPSVHGSQYRKCPFCSRTFITLRSFSFHIFVKHKKGEATYHNCTFCKYKSVFLTNVKRHILRKHTKDEDISWFSCTLCAFRSKTKSYLKEHLKKKHEVEGGTKAETGEIKIEGGLNCS